MRDNSYKQLRKKVVDILKWDSFQCQKSLICFSHE